MTSQQCYNAQACSHLNQRLISFSNMRTPIVMQLWRRDGLKGLHSLLCRLQAGRISSHAELNSLIEQSLTELGIPSISEQSSLNRTDGHRPDGMSAFPWKAQKSLVWDATGADRLADSHVNEQCNSCKFRSRWSWKAASKYHNLIGNYLFQPIAYETTFSCGSSTLTFMSELVSKLAEATEDPREST